MGQISLFLFFCSLCILTGRKIHSGRAKGHGVGAKGILTPMAALVAVLVLSAVAKAGTAQAASPSETKFTGSIREITLEKQIEEYYEAVSAKDTGRAKEVLGIPDSLSVKRHLLLREQGLKSYTDLHTVIYPVGNDRLVFLSYAWEIENFDTKLPGLTTLLAQKRKDGGWILIHGENQDILSPKELERFHERAAALRQDSDVASLFAGVDAAYAEAIAKEPKLQDWAKACSRLLWEADAARSQGLTGNSYTVQKGDCLFSIARHMLGNGCRWTELYEQNQSRIGPNPNLILPGTTLKLPSR